MTAAVTESGRPLWAVVTESGRRRCRRPLQEAVVTESRYRKQPLQEAGGGDGSGRHRCQYININNAQCPEAGCLNIKCPGGPTRKAGAGIYSIIYIQYIVFFIMQ
jgi:hypothetical protein